MGNIGDWGLGIGDYIIYYINHKNKIFLNKNGRRM